MLDEELVNSVMQAEKRMIFRMYIREMHCKEKVMRWKVASKVLRTYYNLYKKAKKNHTLVYLFYQQCFMDILYLITKCFFFTELIFYVWLENMLYAVHILELNYNIFVMNHKKHHWCFDELVYTLILILLISFKSQI